MMSPFSAQSATLVAMTIVVASAVCPAAGAQPTGAVGAAPIATLAYRRATPLTSDGAPIDLRQHAVPRCYDWDADGDLDLLVGGGDGRLWLVQNEGTRRAARFAKPREISCAGRSRWGATYTGVALVNLVGDSAADLVVAHSGKEVAVHRNIGVPGKPEFAESELNVRIVDDNQGRLEVADWDRDGLPDLICGTFLGKLFWHRNEGRAGRPRFGTGVPFHDIDRAYNSHPRAIDFNQDGRLDLLLGVNWGTASLYLDAGGPGERKLNAPRPLHWSDDGAAIDIRKLNGDDLTPELADLDGDGVLDLISGGKNGRLWVMHGVGMSERCSAIEAALARHADDLGAALRDDAKLRQATYGGLVSLQAELASGAPSQAARERLFRQLAPLASRHPGFLRRAKFDVRTAPHLPSLAAQYWVVLLESAPDSPAHRLRVADALGFEAGYRRLLLDFGVLFIDNDTATPQHLEAMHRLIASLPRAVWDVETITVAGWLGPEFKSHGVRSRTGVNIFDLPLGRTEDSFAADSPRPGVTDVFMICLAHELAHNMLDTVGRRTRPELYEKKFADLEQAAGPDVVFLTPKSRGVDFAATRKSFQRIGAWDGQESTWQNAWSAYFRGKERFERGYSRGNVHFFLNAPQEAFATLANQYFADSQLMLEFCKTRWDAGHRTNVAQFLLIADYLSEGGNQVDFFVLRPGGDLAVERVALERDAKGRIERLRSSRSLAEFAYDADGRTSEFRLAPAAR